MCAHHCNQRPVDNIYQHKPRQEFLLFMGKDIHGWLYRVEQLLEFDNTSADQRVRMAALYLDEKPLQWYRWTMTNKGGPIDWEEFVRGLISIYDPSYTISYNGELSKLKQEGMRYDDYQAEFMQLSHHVHGLTHTYKMNCFISGLRETVKYEVMAKKPTTLVEAMRLAKLEEEKTAALRKSAKGNSHKEVNNNFGGATFGVLSTQKPNTTSSTTIVTHPVKKLTQHELKKKRDKGLCFSCDAKYTPEHKCKNQMLFELEISLEEEVEQECEVEEEKEEPLVRQAIKLNLKTIIGVSAIRLVGKINGKEVGFLIDTGATHNFVDPIIVDRLSLKGKNVDTFEVTVVGGEKMSRINCCKEVKLNLQGQESVIDLLVIPLGDAQIILGTVWL